jgi:hypothetical protein
MSNRNLIPTLRAFISNSSLLLLACAAAQAQGSEFLQTHVTRLGSDPSLVRTINGTVTPVTDNGTATFTTFDLTAANGLIIVNSTAVMPASNTTQSASISTNAKWIDGFNFAPSNSTLIGSAATARFVFNLTGNWNYSLNAEAGGSSSYDLQLGNDEYMGSTSPLSGDRGELNLGNLSVITVDQSFNLGTPFTFQVFVDAGHVLHSISDGSTFANISLTLNAVSLQVLDANSSVISGAWTTDSGHDYTISAIPEPATWVLVPALLGLTTMCWRKRRMQS